MPLKNQKRLPKVLANGSFFIQNEFKKRRNPFRDSTITSGMLKRHIDFKLLQICVD